MLKAALFTGLLLSVTAALGQTQPSATNTSKAAQASDDSNRVICETQEQIGSRLASKRICMTASQWKEHEQQVHGQLDQLHQQVQSTGGPG
jgi:hypothetical protein